MLSEPDENEPEKFEAVMDGGEYTNSGKDLIDPTQNPDTRIFLL